MKYFLYIGAVLLLGAGSVSAQKLADWNLGDVVGGDPIDKASLAGRVVAIEYWGTR